MFCYVRMGVICILEDGYRTKKNIHQRLFLYAPAIGQLAVR